MTSRSELLITRHMSRMAWRSSMKCERGVWYEKGAVTKKVVFSSTNIAGHSTVNRGHEHQRLTRCRSACEGRPRRFGGAQRASGT
jgi:hypothetical protein